MERRREGEQGAPAQPGPHSPARTRAPGICLPPAAGPPTPERHPRWRQARAVRGHGRGEGAAPGTGVRAAARVRGPGWELARSGRPRVPARDTAERACAPRRGREASRPYLLPGQRRQRGAGAREARREKALRMRGQSQRVAPPPPRRG